VEEINLPTSARDRTKIPRLSSS